MEEDDLDNFEDAREGSIDDFVFGKPGELTSESTGIASGDASDEAFKMLEREASVRMAASAEAPPVVSAVSAEPASAPASGAGMVSGADAVAEEGEEREAGEESSQWPDLVLGDGRVVPRRKKSVDAGDDMPEEKRNVDLANACKEEGNRHFASGTFDTAAACYTEALRHIPRDSSHDTARAVYYCNRAACSLALGKHEDALYDCDRTIELNPKYVKAYARRAAVFEKFEKLDEALTDMETWLAIEPGSAPAKSGVVRLKRLITERDEKLKEEMMGKLKDMGNWVLGKFGLSVDNFKAVQDPATGSYSINFQK